LLLRNQRYDERATEWDGTQYPLSCQNQCFKQNNACDKSPSPAPTSCEVVL
jgi:hypothetical protein